MILLSRKRHRKSSSYLNDTITAVNVRVPQSRFGVDSEVKKSSIRGTVEDMH